MKTLKDFVGVCLMEGTICFLLTIKHNIVLVKDSLHNSPRQKPELHDLV